jgi:hypothetical protein
MQLILRKEFRKNISGKISPKIDREVTIVETYHWIRGQEQGQSKFFKRKGEPQLPSRFYFATLHGACPSLL